MKRMYIIYEELEDSDCADPIDVLSSIDKAEEVCFELEDLNPGFIYWWREIISSED